MAVSKNLRAIIVERDSYTCALCERAADDVHHIIRRSQGGRNHPHNLVSLCRAHHDLVHGLRYADVPGNRQRTPHGVLFTPEEARQTLVEYIQDYYAREIERGHWCGGY